MKALIAVVLLTVISWLGMASGVPGAETVFFLSLIGVVVAAVSLGNSPSKARTAQRLKPEDALKEGCRFAHFHDETGIAVDTKLRVLRFRDNTMWTPPYYMAIPFDKIRSFEKVFFSGGDEISPFVLDAGLATRVAVVTRASKVRKDNAMKSGIFIKVRDVNRPVFQARFAKESDIDRWMEILQQCINEGNLGAVPEQLK